MSVDIDDMIDISVEVEALNLDGIKQNLLDYVEKKAKIDIDDSVGKADKSAQDASDSATEAAASAESASDSANQASESLGQYYTKSQTDNLLSGKQNTLTFDSTPIQNSTNPVTSGGVYTALAGKANTALSNLSSDGQMIVDSINGTISNCVLEIPQNIKLEISGNTVTLKSGSTAVITGDTYRTFTTTNDISGTFNSDGKYYLMMLDGGSSIVNWFNFNDTGSGSTLPADGSTYKRFFLTTDKKIYLWSNQNSSWSVWNNGACYPLGIIVVSNGVASFAKDSNGNDMIFNGACFVGHHAVIYPNVKVLIPNGLNTDGSLASTSITRSALTIKEITGGQYFATGSATAINARPSYFEVDTIEDLYAKNLQGFYYVKSINQCYSWGGGSGALYAGNCVFIHVNISGGIVTDFTIRQSVRTATVEMVDKALGDVETLLAAV